MIVDRLGSAFTGASLALASQMAVFVVEREIGFGVREWDFFYNESLLFTLE